jgi:hypothetical protein
MAAQLVPYVIWQTWKDTMPLRKRYEGISSMPQVPSLMLQLEATCNIIAQPILEALQGGAGADQLH